MHDLRFGLRLLLRAPGFTALCIAALALGIGANSAIFTVIYHVLLKPLPYADPGRLVRVYQNHPAERFNHFPLAPAGFLDYREQNRVFQDFATYVRQDQQYGGAHPERLTAVRVSAGFFRLLGYAPLLGRAFTAAEQSAGGPTSSIIISYRIWQRLFQGDRQILGRVMRLSDSSFTIVGVMPRGFEHVGGGHRLAHGETVDLWMPFDRLGNRRGLARAFHYCNTVARLKAGVTLQQAEAHMNAIAQRLEAQYPDDQGWRIALVPLQDDIAGKARPVLLILAGAVGFVLLIACVNVANLLLARATARGREMAIRTALGATRARLLRQMLTESLTLAALGGALGLLLAAWGVRALVAIGPEQLPRLHAIHVDARIFLFTAGLSIAAALIFGLAPALAASTNLRRSRPSGVFVVAEIALTFVLLCGAGLLLRTFLAIDRVEPGFHPQHVLTVNTSLSYAKLIGARRYAAFYERFVESLAALPGVTSAGAASNLPWTGAHDEALFGIEGRPRPANAAMHAHYQFVSPDYLRTIGVPLVAGRWLATSDHFDAPKVTLVSKALALEYWPSPEACVGQRIYTIGNAGRIDQTMTVVGVVGDVKDSPTDAAPPPVLYQPFLQNPSFGNYVTLRAAGDPAALIPSVRRVAEQSGADLSIQEIRPLEQVAAAATATERFALQIIGLFALVALTLALIGIYGVMSYAAARRAREIAIRIALGARQQDTLRLLLGHGVRLIAAGLILGGAAAAGLTRALKGLLYQVTPADPLTFAAVAAILGAVAAAACFAPAWRALSINPIRALRHE